VVKEIMAKSVHVSNINGNFQRISRVVMHVNHFLKALGLNPEQGPANLTEFFAVFRGFSQSVQTNAKPRALHLLSSL
jgi:hypothetical protein